MTEEIKKYKNDKAAALYAPMNLAYKGNILTDVAHSAFCVGFDEGFAKGYTQGFSEGMKYGREMKDAEIKMGSHQRTKV